jgi:PAS domain S-box-containing protein
LKTKRQRLSRKGRESRTRSGIALLRKAEKRKTGGFSRARKFSTNGVRRGRNGDIAIVDLTERKKTEDALRRSQARYRTLFDFVPVAVYTCDADGLIQEYNQRAVKLWGRKPKINDPSDRFCGSFKIFYPDGRVMPHWECPMARVLRGENLANLEIVVERRSGERRNVMVNPTALRNEHGKIIGAINCLYDVTESKRAEEALRESEELHRALVSQTAVGMARSDLQGRFAFVNKKFCELLGYKESELVGKKIIDVTHSADVPQSRRLFRRLIEQGASYHLEKRYIRKDGSLVWVNVSASPMRDVHGKTRAAIAVIRDISGRKQAQGKLENAKQLLETRVQERTAELLTANEELQNEIALRKRLEGEILEISDREQRRLGQDLHDSLCQHLTATAFMTRALGERMRMRKTVNAKELDKICDLINAGVTEARMIARGLHPVEVESGGLAVAMRSLLHQQSKLPYRLDMDEDMSIPDPTVALHLYRIAREAVINANKHARARAIFVRMRQLPKQIELSVTDDGVGLGKNTTDGAGMGFHIMNYRARSIGARLEITAVKPHGTRVACYLPRK